MIGFFKSKQTHLVFGLFLIVFSIFLLVSFVSFLMHWKEDQSQLILFSERLAETRNLLGKIGAEISHFFIYQGFGIASFIVPVLLFFSGVFVVFNFPFRPLMKSWFWGLIAMIWLALAIGFFIPSNSLLSGIVGYEMNDFLKDFIGKTGV
ncbi:MAG: DNA translocase FtsK 4TM domain-containing protein, partial [Flavobacteriaceae bacterium]|nr:DNA translocase FtsK 4TM domain-containing protein [Flavobacteriaceae bacterium]